MTKRKKLLLCGLALCLFAAVMNWANKPSQQRRSSLPPLLPKTRVAAQILAGAKAQQGTSYNASYRVIAYPNGDVPVTQGACTDVIIRALRKTGVDLQKLIHEDMTRDFKSYPQSWGLQTPNSHIDHRRVPNQMHFFARHGKRLTNEVSSRTLNEWQPGDLVYWNTGRNLHTGVVSDSRNGFGEPMVIHNGWKCVEDDALTRWKIIGHFRYP